jgi:hypothetical protein
MLLRVLPVVALFLVVAGCSSHPKRVDCETHLKAINAPAPAERTGAHP